MAALAMGLGATDGIAAAGEVAFVHGGRIWTMSADGSSRQPLPLPARVGGHRIRYASVAWSRDGEWLAVVKSQDVV